MNRLSFFLVALMAMACIALAEQGTFTDASDLINAQPASARVVAWGDINGDGHPDLFVGGGHGLPSYIYIYEKGEFHDRTSEYLLGVSPSNVYSAQFIDYNNDGRMDLFVLTDDRSGGRLFEQTASHFFVPVNVFGSMLFADPIRSAVWTDIDGNGMPDLVVSNAPKADGPVTVFAQSIKGFSVMRNSQFPSVVGVGAMTFADFDGDGQPEAFFGSLDGSQPAHFYKYEGKNWVDLAPDFDLPAKLGGRGAVWLDYDNDCRMDLFCTGSSEYTAMFRGATWKGDNTIEPVKDPSLASADDGYEVHAVDVNMDGYTDMFITRAAGRPCAMMINQGGVQWVEKAATLGIANANHTNYSCAWADFDGNGSPDLAIAQGTDGVRLYRNNTRTDHEYLLVNLLSHDTHTPLLNCNLAMDWNVCKEIASTFTSSCAAGSDGSTVLLVNRADSAPSRPSEIALAVQWPNGFTTNYSMTDLRKVAVNNLYEPSSMPSSKMVPPHTSGTLTRATVSPNPFNPTTTISFDLPQPSNVELRVYDLMGREVATLLNGSQEAGNHRVTFDARALPSGLYFSRLTVSGTSSLTRMLLMK